MRKYQVNICWMFFLNRNRQDDSVEILARVDSVDMFCLFLILWHCFLQVWQLQSKVQSAWLWFCKMNFYKFYRSHPKSRSTCLWFCSMSALKSCKPHPKVPNACLWFCSKNLFTSFTSQSKMSQMAWLWFCSMSSFRKIYKSVKGVQNDLVLIL